VRVRLKKPKPSSIVFQLANCSTRLPKGIVEDLLIKVGEFKFLVEFVGLETEIVMYPENEIVVNVD